MATIANIRLQSFRSYHDATFECSDSVNIIVGPNASGKTNLLEAILVLAEGGSYRAADSDLIQFGQPWARLDARMFTPGDPEPHYRTVKLEHSGAKVAKSYVIDERPFKRLTHAHMLPAVLFEPDHLFLLSGQPEARRNFLDDLLEKIQPGYASQRRQYKRIVSQRNALLKNPPSRQKLEADLFVWNIRLSELGGVIARARAQLISNMAAQLTELYGHISHSETEVTVEYVSKVPLAHYETTLLRQLDAHLEIDIARGYTTYGPHRDDFRVLFGGHEAADVASRGEVRSALLALKIIELKLIEVERGAKPLLLLDDVFSELDGRRRRALTSFLRPYQTFITTTDADILAEHFLEDARIITLG